MDLEHEQLQAAALSFSFLRMQEKEQFPGLVILIGALPIAFFLAFRW
jgi:hypothetical protein